MSFAINAAQLCKLVQHPGVVVVDVRPRWRFHQAHVPGSHSIPAGVLLASELPQGDLLLIGTDSADSKALIEELHEQGYNRRLRYLEGGFATWSSQQLHHPDPFWGELWAQGRQLIGGSVLVLMGGATQSLGLLALGLVVSLGPWALTRSRA